MLAPRRVSLNAVAEAATISLIQGVIDAGADLQQVFVDTVGDADRYRERLSAVFPGLAFTVAPKADALYPLVSAASIAAKVLRDAALEHEAAAMPGGGGGPVGNGYPSDPCTQAWLAAAADRLFGFPPLVRFSWETAAR
jgi:ribonuclease H2 subunit A